LIRSLVPQGLRAGIGTYLIERRERAMGRLPLPEAFDEVYRRGMWRQGKSLSGIGSEGPLAERYVSLVREYAAAHGLRTALDGGAGDFSVGSRLAMNFDRYTAMDVSPRIIDIDRQKFAGPAWQHVEFIVADLTAGPFPSAELVLIRQVLQHLTNVQIGMVLKNLEASSWRRALITEDVHDPVGNQSPNRDLPSHTVRTRRSLGSGVFLDQPPFDCAVRRLATILPSGDAHQRAGGLLVFEFNRDS
jgi:hypothetical protein